MAEKNLAKLDWSALAERIDQSGFATTPPLLTPSECRALIALYGEADRFRRRIVMQHHGYGQGEYQYFAYPLPAAVANCARPSMPGWHLSPIAGVRRWRRSGASRPPSRISSPNATARARRARRR
jgi:hypothetical protein